jgi:hypothetical protein
LSFDSDPKLDGIVPFNLLEVRVLLTGEGEGEREKGVGGRSEYSE